MSRDEYWAGLTGCQMRNRRFGGILASQFGG
jgi:hypothetical protein